MVDVHSPNLRSNNMRAVRAKNTRPEIFLRKLLFSQGLRYRLHVDSLPGKPDIVLPKYHVAIFVNGCFWHAHNCYLFRLPNTRKDFWQNKIGINQNRDRRNWELLQRAGWRVLIVWECAIRGRLSWNKLEFSDHINVWIRTENCSERLTEICHLPENQI